MLALVLFISLLCHISCQRTELWPFSRSLQGCNNDPRLQNLPSYQTYQEFIPQSMFISRPELSSVSPIFKSPVPSYTFEENASVLKRKTGSHYPFTPNLSQKMSEILSKISEATPPTPRALKSFESMTGSSQLVSSSPSAAQIETFSPSTSYFPLLPSSAPSSQMPSAISSPIKSPRSIIPSPLTDTICSPNPYSDPFANIYDLPEPRMKSVGCLDLTMTPYGTISETPLPDPSIPLPRSPFLPISSPVSALAPPLSPSLPPASLASSSANFLRKIPIPPPFI